MSEKRTIKKKLFFIGLAVFALGLILPALNYAVPSPVPTPTYQDASTTYFFPFLNFLTIGGIAIAVVALFMEKKKRET